MSNMCSLAMIVSGNKRRSRSFIRTLCNLDSGVADGAGKANRERRPRATLHVRVNNPARWRISGRGGPVPCHCDALLEYGHSLLDTESCSFHGVLLPLPGVKYAGTSSQNWYQNREADHRLTRDWSLSRTIRFVPLTLLFLSFPVPSASSSDRDPVDRGWAERLPSLLCAYALVKRGVHFPTLSLPEAHPLDDFVMASRIFVFDVHSGTKASEVYLPS